MFLKLWLFLGCLWLCEASYHLVWLSKEVKAKPHIEFQASNFQNQLSNIPSRRPKQLIGASVVTSVTSVKEHDPEGMKRRHENEYQLNNGNISSAMVMEPKFYFYLYNDEGDLIREKLSIHDIQSLLLQQTQIEGLKNRGWLFEEKGDPESITPPSTTTTSTTQKLGIPSKIPSQEDVNGVLDKIHNIIEDVKTQNMNEIVLSSQINITGIPERLEEKTQESTPGSRIPDQETDLSESKTGNFKIYEERYHGLHGNEYPWVDFGKQNELAHLEQGLSEPLSRTSQIKDDLSYFPVHPQLYRNKVFKDFLSLEYEASPYDEENGSSFIQMVSVGDESDLVPVIYSDDVQDDEEEEEEPQSHDHAENSHDDILHAENSHHEGHHEHGDPSSMEDHHSQDHHHDHHHEHSSSTDQIKDIPSPPEGHLGLLDSTEGLDRNTKHFISINNDLSFHLYATFREKNSSNTNLIFSPLSAISTLSMIFLGARGMSSWQMNELLHLDEMISFNPHLLYKELMDSIMTSGSAGFVKQLLIDQKEDPLIDFYKSRIQYFYKGHADKIDFEKVSMEFKERINSLFKELNPSESEDILLDSHEITSEPPMAVMGASYFNCELNTDALRGIQPAEINYINLPSYGRKLVRIPGLSLQGEMQAGYDPFLDATSVQIPLRMPLNLSLILVLPGKPWEFKVGGLSSLESKLNSRSWSDLLKRFVPLEEVHVYVPELREASLMNLNTTFSHMGSTEIFGEEANFVGINGGRDLRLSAFYEFTKFSLGESSIKTPSSSTKADPYVFRFERQFLYVLRHNPTGLVVSLGRYVKPASENL